MCTNSPASNEYLAPVTGSATFCFASDLYNFRWFPTRKVLVNVSIIVDRPTQTSFLVISTGI